MNSQIHYSLKIILKKKIYSKPLKSKMSHYNEITKLKFL